jgi:formylglycine-generating enzyme required for sulfatase activity
MMTKLEPRSVWSGHKWFVLGEVLVVALANSGCGNDEKIHVSTPIDYNELDDHGLTVDPTALPCQDAAWSDDVCIPGGEFVMGHKLVPYTPPPCPPDEVCGPGNPPPKDYAPPHIVKLSPYFIDRYPATNAEYKACYDAGVCPGDCLLLKSCGGTTYNECRFTDPLQAAYPVVTITAVGAEAYCQWKGKRLPTEAEWERAARGAKSFNYPWGNEPPDCTRYICNPTDMPASWSKYWFAPVGANPGDVSPEGVHEMVTSSIQLVHDTYGYYYYEHSPYENPQGPAVGNYRAGRGDITRRGRLGGYVVYNGVTSPSPAWVRIEKNVGGVRCARSDDTTAASTGEQFFRLRQRMLRGERFTNEGSVQ